MASYIINIMFLASPIFVLSFLSLTYADPPLSIEGKVYCDNCRVQFITKATTYIKGARVRLECTNREGGAVNYTKEAETDETGTYHIQVEGDHEEELCKVMPVKSPDPDCNEINQEPFVKEAASISLTEDNGISTSVRMANPIGFMTKQTLPECVEILREMGITPSGLVP